jgi:alpha-galactosidase
MKAGLILLLAWFAASAAEPVAATPPMGWNSWDCYGSSVTEAEVKANADYMAAKLKSHGWQYVVLDIQWSEPLANPHGYHKRNAVLDMDEYGRLIPAANRFPSGFKGLAGYLHGKGLKFGIHIMRGIPRRAVAANLPVLGGHARAADIADTKSTCTWNADMYGIDMSKPGAQDYYDSIAQLYAEWGVDYIKCDDIAQPFHGGEIAALHQAIGKTGRAIVLSLSPGPADLAKADFYAANANLWRISNDFWDVWRDLRGGFDLLEKWSPFGKPGGWPDGDMLPLGRIGIRSEHGRDRPTRFTRDEQRTLITLWSIARSPLMFGGDLPSNDAFTESLLTNDEVLAANQKGTGARKLSQDGDAIIWTSEVEGAKYLAVFNTGQQKREIAIPASGPLRDVWEKKDVGVLQSVKLAPHACAMYRVQK